MCYITACCTVANSQRLRAMNVLPQSFKPLRADQVIPYGGYYMYVDNFSPDKAACAPSLPAPRQCTPPRPAHSLRHMRMRPHSAVRIHTTHVSCELLAATHTHNTLHCTCTFLHSAHNKRVMIFLDTANTTHAPRASSHFSHALRASTPLYCTRIRNRERKWLHLCFLLRWHCNLTLCTFSCSRRITNNEWAPPPSPSSSPPSSSPPPSPLQTPPSPPQTPPPSLSPSPSPSLDPPPPSPPCRHGRRRRR